MNPFTGWAQENIGTLRAMVSDKNQDGSKAADEELETLAQRMKTLCGIQDPIDINNDEGELDESMLKLDALAAVTNNTDTGTKIRFAALALLSPDLASIAMSYSTEDEIDEGAAL